jgi:hypothetical protein
VQTLSQLLPQSCGITPHNTMSLIKNCIVVLCNGNVVGMHLSMEAAEQQSHELAFDWKRQVDCGAEVPVPKLAVLDFNSWMELQAELVF